MALDDFFADRQANASPVRLLAVHQTFEGLKQIFRLRLFKPDPIIFYPDLDQWNSRVKSWYFLEAYSYMRRHPRPLKLDGIADQVLKKPLDL
jgi:hypothetical protein